MGGRVGGDNVLSLGVSVLIARHARLAITDPDSVPPNSSTLVIIGIGPSYTIVSDAGWYGSLQPMLAIHSGAVDGLIGFGGQAQFGKDWAMSKTWRLGVGGQFTLTTANAGYANAPWWTGWSTGLVLFLTNR